MVSLTELVIAIVFIVIVVLSTIHWMKIIATKSILFKFKKDLLNRYIDALPVKKKKEDIDDLRGYT